MHTDSWNIIGNREHRRGCNIVTLSWNTAWQCECYHRDRWQDVTISASQSQASRRLQRVGGRQRGGTLIQQEQVSSFYLRVMWLRLKHNYEMMKLLLWCWPLQVWHVTQNYTVMLLQISPGMSWVLSEDILLRSLSSSQSLISRLSPAPGSCMSDLRDELII